MPDAIRPILLVEDNADDLEMAVRALLMNNIENEIVVARDGVAAIDFLNGTGQFSDRNDKTLPQVVLLDLKLPKLDGLKVLQRIRANPLTRRLAVVILTSSNEEQDVINSYDLGANSFVKKPAEFQQFIEAVRQPGLYWLLVNRPESGLAP